MPGRERIAVIGLGYVGLPLALALARQFETIGLDIDSGRVRELRGGHDRTGEIEDAKLSASTLTLTDRPEDCAGYDVYIVTVPTPVDSANQPDLRPVESATRTVAGLIDPALRPTIVYESTVYPGVTEEVCAALLEEAGLVRGRDFRLGYSPERINPGDKVHTVDKIVKVIAGEDDEVCAQLERIYGAVTEAGTFRAASIRAAEGAKVIENAQRDINVAFMNEVARIMADAGVSAWDVLDAARTKWNFLPFEPGLVGGHCIGVDPFYLAHLAEKLGHQPQVILAGRDTNDTMGAWIIDRLHARRGGKAGRALVLGLTFKENVPDLRNSRSADLVERLEYLGYDVAIADPVADADEVRQTYGRAPVELPAEGFDLVIGAVRHAPYQAMGAHELAAMVAPGGTIADIKAMWRDQRGEIGRDYWSF
ncbi:nucleotide sugar dehydrogenase [Sphingomonas mesophila]|uniref:nucleotide sugar dehydrogenase n=1 Tax=Sphingomonas mesophila TaxID=2303576 RepID=UPI000E57CD3A|nr:nucleotide sugar dehydrogenase [Sphingomonas mesophila]